jgi:hypothetical protein
MRKSAGGNFTSWISPLHTIIRDQMMHYMPSMLITVAVRSMTWTLIASWNTEIVVSNRIRFMCVCLRLFWLFCVGSGHVTCWSPAQGVLPTIHMVKKV